MITVNRGGKSSAMQSLLENAKPVIEAGVPILIYPQGTRARVGATLAEKPYKQGAIRIYENFNVPILPVAMNSGLFWSRKAFIKRRGVVTFKIMPVIPAGLKPSDAFDKMRDVIETESDKLIKL